MTAHLLAEPARALLVKEPWVSLILDGEKDFELRGSATSVRGRIALARSGSGLIVGTVDLVDARALTLTDLHQSVGRHRVPLSALSEPPYANTHAWVLEDALWLPEPVPYSHPSGAVIWVRLPQDTARAVSAGTP